MNKIQKEAYLNFMEINYIKLYGRHGALKGPQLKAKLWKQLSESLNLLGPQKNVDGWKLVLINLLKQKKS